MNRVIVIGGGLAGLISSIELARAGIQCHVVEKKRYPFHRVCGEYISNEVVPYLESVGLYPHHLRPPKINTFQLSSTVGRSKVMQLDLGGFGISRFAFDNFLYNEARKLGVEFFQDEEVKSVVFRGNTFLIKTALHEWECDIVIGAFGKRSKIDHQLNRSFTRQRSPYVGIKYHIRTKHPDNLISLHNFQGGYCGLSNIEEGKTTLCYLSHRSNLKEFKDIREMERRILYKNPLLRDVFENAEFLFTKPEVINEISFQPKSPVEDHILMTGDAAGMIAPLCGNGMAMAIQSARLAVRSVVKFIETSGTRQQMEEDYYKAWRTHFEGRLWLGRQVQKLFGRDITSRFTVSLVMNIEILAKAIIKNTHGQPF
ncbi:MAG: NAD(P)/FAD-dependent oxidoreductase [Chryseolinea sp.]